MNYSKRINSYIMAQKCRSLDQSLTLSGCDAGFLIRYGWFKAAGSGDVKRLFSFAICIYCVGSSSIQGLQRNCTIL